MMSIPIPCAKWPCRGKIVKYGQNHMNKSLLESDIWETFSHTDGNRSPLLSIINIRFFAIIYGWNKTYYQLLSELFSSIGVKRPAIFRFNIAPSTLDNVRWLGAKFLGDWKGQECYFNKAQGQMFFLCFFIFFKVVGNTIKRIFWKNCLRDGYR